MARQAAIHTLPSKQGGWTNERERSGETIGTYSTKAEAQAAGRDLARQDETEHRIHTKDGRISARNSYGNDPPDARVDASFGGDVAPAAGGDAGARRRSGTGRIALPGGVQYEQKWDGYRLVSFNGDDVYLQSRRGADLTASFPEVAAAVSELPDRVLDGELVIWVMTHWTSRVAAADGLQPLQSSPARRLPACVLRRVRHPRRRRQGSSASASTG